MRKGICFLSLILKPALINRAAVHYGLSVAVAAQYDEKIADHLRLSFFVKLNGVVAFQASDSHFNHADRSVHYHFARVYNSGSLLALKHNGGDFGRVGKIGYARFYDGYARRIHAGLNFFFNAVCDSFARTAKRAVVGKPVAVVSTLGATSYGYTRTTFLSALSH